MTVLKNKAKQIRLLTLDMIYRAKTSHIGTAFSCADILTALYFGDVMNIKPESPFGSERDRFILSKGHGCSAFYAALALKGYFPVETLGQFSQDGSNISCHATLGVLPGIEATGGSGGHGLSIGAGMALAAKLDSRSSQIFVLTGDGECQEGSIWEAAMFAGQCQLNNLNLIVDNNRLQILGKTRDIVDPEPLLDKLHAFNWQTVCIDGHNFDELLRAFESKTSKPKAIIANTKKGKGVSFMEDNYLWHSLCPDEKEYQQAKKELENAN